MSDSKILSSNAKESQVESAANEVETSDLFRLSVNDVPKSRIVSSIRDMNIPVDDVDAFLESIDCTLNALSRRDVSSVDMGENGLDLCYLSLKILKSSFDF